MIMVFKKWITFLLICWKEDLLFRVVTLEIQQPSAGFVSEISRPTVVITENYTCQNLLSMSLTFCALEHICAQ